MLRIYVGVIGAVMLFGGCAHHAHAEVTEALGGDSLEQNFVKLESGTGDGGADV